MSDEAPATAVVFCFARGVLGKMEGFTRYIYDDFEVQLEAPVALCDLLHIYSMQYFFHFYSMLASKFKLNLRRRSLCNVLSSFVH